LEPALSFIKALATRGWLISYHSPYIVSNKSTPLDNLQRVSASAVFGATVSQCHEILLPQNVGAWHACICATTSETNTSAQLHLL
jgi:hypothetical protein